MTFSVIVLAAGQGIRMQSALPKVLHPIGGVPMIEHVIRAAKSLNPAPAEIMVVYGYEGETLKQALIHHPDLIFVEQNKRQGTGHAVLQAIPHVKTENVLILYGDAPLIQPQNLQSLIEMKENKNASLAILTAHANPPTGFGRIVRNKNNDIDRIVEEKEANAKEKTITEINTGIIFAETQKLKEWLPKLTPNNTQKEYYLTDIVSFAREETRKKEGEIANVLLQSMTECLGVNDKQQLAQLERIYQQNQAIELMQKGVTLLDPHRLDIRGKVTVGKEVCIDINVIFEGNVILEDGVKIGPNVVIKESTLKKGVEVFANCVIEGAILGEKSVIGPFARIRKGTITREAVKIGNFVETKEADIGKGSKINHLSYVGDALLGQHVNVGAGTITCNYDGKMKHKTVIEDGVFIGSDTQLIAPITIGENSIIGAGTTVVKDVPSNHLIHNQIQHRCVNKEK